MKFKIISNLISSTLGIVCLTVLFVMCVFPQISEEEKRRIDFVKSLKKKKRSSEVTRKPLLGNDNKKLTDTNPADDEEVIKVETRLVQMDILVYDGKGNTVIGLKPEDFILTENMVAQEVGAFSLGNSKEVPRSIVLIMDYSGSQRPYIKTSVAAAKILVDKLNPQDQMAIVTDDVELLVDFTRDRELLKNSLDKLGKKAERNDVGRSLQLSALYVTLREMFDNEDLRPIIIFQTDGDQLFSISNENATIDMQSRRLSGFTDREMIAAIEKSRTTIYSVISGFSLLGLSPDEQAQKAAPFLGKQYPNVFREHPETIPSYVQRLFRQQNAMVNIAKISGGFAENLETPDQADAVYEHILKDITNRYLIGYYPTNQDRDGQRRNVKIEVRGHPEYTILGRKFYFAPQDRTVKTN